MEWELVTSFYIDTDAYSDRDRLMFCCGVEFNMVLKELTDVLDEITRTIHRENESRIKILCGRMGRRFMITHPSTEHDPQQVWSYLKVEAKS